MSIEKFEARWTAKGFTQIKGMNFDETVARINSAQVIFTEAARLDMEIEQMDVKTAFLNSDLKEEICMSQQQGMEDKLVE